MPEVTAREAALLTLSACERQGAWSDGYLKKILHDASLSPRDAALCTRLCFGVLQNKLLLDWHLARCVSTPLKRLEDKVLQALRLGAYQILFLTRVPESAAVNESVKLAKRYTKNPRAAGVVNAVLRRLIREGETRPEPTQLAIRYSHPQWLVDTFVSLLGTQGAQRLLAANNGQPPMTAQVNTCKTDAATLLAELSGLGVDATPHPWLEDVLILAETGNLERLSAFQEGKFYIQDAAAKLAVLAAAPRSGMKVLDACAAPGGKSFAAAMLMQDAGEILSRDIHPHKKALIEAGAERLGLTSIHAAVGNARQVEQALWDCFDLVIADVPCSGLGIIRKKPDIRYKEPEPLEGLPAVQQDIIASVSRCVRPGGVLLYATCTLLPGENQEVVAQFLATHPDFSAEGFTLPGPVGDVPSGMVTLWPHIHETDGFFFAKLRRGRETQ